MDRRPARKCTCWERRTCRVGISFLDNWVCIRLCLNVFQCWLLYVFSMSLGGETKWNDMKEWKHRAKVGKASSAKPSCTKWYKPFQKESISPLYKWSWEHWRCPPALDMDLRCNSMKQERGYQWCNSSSQQKRSILNLDSTCPRSWNMP